MYVHACARVCVCVSVHGCVHACVGGCDSEGKSHLPTVTLPALFW